MNNHRDDPSHHRPWWERRVYVAALILLAFVPLIYPEYPPLVDLPGHMGRYRVEMSIASSPDLQRFYGFDWRPIGNLGVDLLVAPLGRLIGLEAAVKLIVMTIPPLTVAGFLWVAREVHHRLPPTAVFALPFAFAFPFLFGFVNFALAMALAMLAFALWLRLARQGRDRLRAVLFVPISFLLFFTHAFGWGMLGLLCFSAEAVRQHDRGLAWFRAGFKAALHAAVLALPMFVILLWRSGTSGELTHGWFDWPRKWLWVYSALRDRWEWFDIAAVAAVGVVLVFAIFHRRLEYSRNLAFSALVLVAAFLLLPWTVFGSAYADMRLVPYIFALALLAIRFKGPTDLKLAGVLATLALALLAVRLAGTTASLALAADHQRERLAALDHVPRGARLVHLAGQMCADHWALPRNSHLGGMALVRRHAFSNEQWAIDGANLLQVRFTEAGPFRSDPSQIVREESCANANRWSADQALRSIPRGVFDYAWLIDMPPYDRRLTEGWALVWSGEGSLLYRLPESPEDE
ncbi:MAG TPA: hypothetical protein VFO42_07700 [Sphingomicrobium sp.]|nr:hypothetical protein [Sphingomicrobium sp.]